VRYAGAYHCCRSSSSSPGLLSVTTSLRRYGTAEGSISHLSRHDIARQLGLQMRDGATSSRAPRGPQRPATGVLGRRPDQILGGSSQPPGVYLNPPGHGAPPPLGPSSHQGPMRWTTQESQGAVAYVIPGAYK